jgi:hypothetical protein
MDILLATLMGACFVAAVPSLLKAPVTVITRRRHDANVTAARLPKLPMEYR